MHSPYGQEFMLMLDKIFLNPPKILSIIIHD
jgi:hypothetical protein